MWALCAIRWTSSHTTSLSMNTRMSMGSQSRIQTVMPLLTCLPTDGLRAYAALRIRCLVADGDFVCEPPDTMPVPPCRCARSWRRTKPMPTVTAHQRSPLHRLGALWAFTAAGPRLAAVGSQQRCPLDLRSRSHPGEQSERMADAPPGEPLRIQFGQQAFERALLEGSDAWVAPEPKPERLLQQHERNSAVPVPGVDAGTRPAQDR